MSLAFWLGCLPLPRANLARRLKMARAARPPTQSWARRRPHGAAAGLTLWAPGPTGTGIPRTLRLGLGDPKALHKGCPAHGASRGPRTSSACSSARAQSGRHGGPRARPSAVPRASGGPTALVRAREAGERRGPAPASEQRRGPRVAVRSGPSPPQEENNTTATWPRRGARREEGGRKSRLAAGGCPGPGSPSARECTAARAKGDGFRRARNARIPAGGMGTAVSQTGGWHKSPCSSRHGGALRRPARRRKWSRSAAPGRNGQARLRHDQGSGAGTPPARTRTRVNASRLRRWTCGA